MGNVIFKYGCMNSGKSMHLLATAYNLQERKINFLVIKSSIDTRDKGVIHSRSLGDRECITISPFDSIRDTIIKKNNTVQRWILDGHSPRYILVDEAQFLTEPQVDDLTELADDFGFEVICYGLRTNFQTYLFEGSKRLFEVADKIEEIPSICSCGKPTIFNARIEPDGHATTSGEEIEVGSEDKYEAVCRDCFYKKLDT